MKLPTLAFAALAFAAATATAGAETVTGSGNATTDTRAAAGVRSVAISVPGRLEIVQGDTEKLAITGDDNIVALIETPIEGGKLRIRFKDHRNLNVRPKTPLRMVLNAREIEAISVAGSGDVQAAALTAKTLSLSVAGSGDILLGGKAQSLDVQIAGSGDIKAGRFQAQAANVNIAGSGDATLWVRDTLNVSIAGSGDVRYYGDPGVKTSVVGSGSTRRLGASPS